MAAAYIQLVRSDEARELLRHPYCFALLALVAQRARREVPPINPHGLQVGEAMLGDPEAVGLTRQQFRTALANLQKWGFITTRTTNKGTIARLVGRSVFDINCEGKPNQPATSQQPANNQQANQPATSKTPSNTDVYGVFDDETNQQLNQGLAETQPAANQRLTTNKNDKKKRRKNTPSAGPATPSPAAITFTEFWDAFAKKEDKYKASKAWAALDAAERTAALAAVPAYVAGTPDKKYRKNPLTWLNAKGWLDEETPASRVVVPATPQPAPQLAPPAPAPALNHAFIAQQEAADAAATAAHLAKFSKP